MCNHEKDFMFRVKNSTRTVNMGNIANHLAAMLSSATNHSETWGKPEEVVCYLSGVGMSCDRRPSAELDSDEVLLIIESDGVSVVNEKEFQRNDFSGDFEIWAVSKAGALSDIAKSHSPMKSLWKFVGYESSLIRAIIAYSLVTAILALVVPITAQAVVSNIAMSAVIQPLVVLTASIFIALCFSGILHLLQIYTVEILQRRIFCRLSENISETWLHSVENLSKEKRLSLNNRFFDIVTLQKSGSTFLVQALALLIQTTVAITLLALYHPLLSLFALLAIFLFVGVLALGYRGAPSAKAESSAKYSVAESLDKVASSATYFHDDYTRANYRDLTSDCIRDWLTKRSNHFSAVWRISVAGVVAQVLVLTLLFSMGGWLVFEGQLTVGQLVAAELMLGLIAMSLLKIGPLSEKAFDVYAGWAKIADLLSRRGSGRSLITDDENRLKVDKGEKVFLFASADTDEYARRLILQNAPMRLVQSTSDLPMRLEDCLPQGSDGSEYGLDKLIKSLPDGLRARISESQLLSHHRSRLLLASAAKAEGKMFINRLVESCRFDERELAVAFQSLSKAPGTLVVASDTTAPPHWRTAALEDL